MRISQTGGLIAAASKKASRPTLQLGGITAVKRIVFTFQQVGLFPIVVVTGVEADEVKYQLADRGVIFLHNEAFEDPELLDSVKMGLSFLHGKCKRVVFSPVNTPLFSPATLRALMDSDAEIATPVYQNRGGHPVMLSNNVIPDILDWQQGSGLRGALAALRHKRQQVPVDDEGILLTIHQKAELLAYYKQHKAAFLRPVLNLNLEQEEALWGARAKLLLLLIDETHSVRTASSMMALSISKAWDILNRLEAALGYALITRRKGGAHGSGSDLTPEGLAFLAAWQRYEESLTAQANSQFDLLFRNASPTPDGRIAQACSSDEVFGI